MKSALSDQPTAPRLQIITEPLRAHRQQLLLRTVSVCFVLLLAGAGVGLWWKGSWTILACGVALVVPLFRISIVLAGRILRAVCDPVPVPLLYGPPRCCIVVVPVIIDNLQALEPIIASALSNTTAIAPFQLFLLVDLADASDEKLPSDPIILSQLKAALSASGADVLVRERRFNSVEQCWMGWERKRGKIEEFLKLIGGDQHTSFGPVNMTRFASAQVITIDLDARIDAETVRALQRIDSRTVALVAPQINVDRRNVAGLYERLVLPLRKPQDAKPSDFQTITGCDLYQGKGLMNSEPFLVGTAHIPENRVLSHDHLESLLTGCITTPAASLSEAFPTNRRQWARRQLRWVRGDTQLIGWITGNLLDAYGRFRLAHNLILHATAPACVATTLFALLFLPAAQALALCGAALVLIKPEIIMLPVDAAKRQFELSALAFIDRLRDLADVIGFGILDWFADLLYGARNAWISMRAFGQVTWRLGYSKRNLLEWSTARRSNHTSDAIGFAIALGVLLVILAVGSGTQFIAMALFLLWIVVPLAIDFIDDRRAPPMR